LFGGAGPYIDDRRDTLARITEFVATERGR